MKYMKYSLARLFVCLSFFLPSFVSAGCDVAAIVWPAYQPEPRWAELNIFKHGCGEWQNVYEAESKESGHRRPLVPLWGYENEADPIVMARKIDACLASGINVLIYDWYWYEGRPFLEDGLNKGFLKAPNNERMKFFLMWANHDVNNLWDKKVGLARKFVENHWLADVDFEEFKNVLVPRWISYFKKPNYYQVDGKPVLAVYLFKKFAKGIGGDEKAKSALAYLDAECRKAGFKGVYIMATAGRWNRGLEVEKFPIDGLFNYNWSELVRTDIADIEYADFFYSYAKKYEADAKLRQIPYFPNVTIGWDDNSRYPANEKRPYCKGKSPEIYERALLYAKKCADREAQKNAPKLIVINALNEWTEDAYLEPDEQFGYEYLNRTSAVFGGKKDKK